MIATHNIEEIRFDKGIMFLTIDGKQIEVKLDKISTKLNKATEMERSLYKISPSGYGIHWPLIDDDLSIESLLK